MGKGSPMSARSASQAVASGKSMHGLGVVCGLAAGVWLGAAEAPTKLVSSGFSPFAISLCMVMGVFVARWTVPTLLKGTDFVFSDISEKRHLIVWAILAGALWAVGNTLTVFAIRDVGLAIAFPLWNTNCLIGIFWGWLLFRELRNGGTRNWARVIGGALGIVVAAVMLGFASMRVVGVSHERAPLGVLAALGASLMWGTMYIPYRKSYLSGMSPLSFVTVFTVGELGTMTVLALTLRGGIRPLALELGLARGAIFWLFLGGFCWVIGDLFQQYAAKYIGIGRGIPLSNTNQFWGLAWGGLVFHELAGAQRTSQLLVVAGSAIMILGALAISSAVAPGGEQTAASCVIERECRRYGLDLEQALAAQQGEESRISPGRQRAWWDYLIVALAVGIFLWLAKGTKRPPLEMNGNWIAWLSIILLVVLFGGGWMVWKKTRFC
jgi:drug/metabolite transporter (DMT)-like permease